ncbi:MAG: lipid II flippase MurJ, partial [Sulfurimonas sp.]|nr:lipid II flippase MurJ [Sulfurimonas sp.]
IGLLPFGLAKLFSLWLYAKEMQMKAAKIATVSLIIYIILALSLIQPLGVAGLALASTIGGMSSFIFTIKVFGFSEFMKIVYSKNSVILLVSAIVFTVVLLTLKSFLIP